MEKKNLFRIYCSLFVLPCLVLSVGTIFAPSESSAEKRELSEFPSFRTEEGKLNQDFFSEFDLWFSEHFAFRTSLVNANGRVNSFFGNSANEKVIVGSDGWLYYGETADDFLNINSMSRCGIKNVAHNLRMIDEYCRGEGADFLFFCAPNKNSLYPENMPPNYVPSDGRNNYSLLSEELSGEGFFLDMKEKLSGAEASIPLYHKTDTHWNNMGAYVGHTAIMAHFGLKPCAVGNWYTKNDRLGDLANMIYPAEEAKDLQVYSDYDFNYQYKGLFRGFDSPLIETVNGNADGSLYMFRDSYGEAILSYMAECFADAEFSRVVPYTFENIGGKKIVLEIVERNIFNLQKFAPVIPAPIVEEEGGTVAEGVTFRTRESGRFTHVFGVVPEEYFSGDSHRIFVESGGNLYEAFNCFESGLLECEDEKSDFGFSAYIETESDDFRFIVYNN